MFHVFPPTDVMDDGSDPPLDKLLKPYIRLSGHGRARVRMQCVCSTLRLQCQPPQGPTLLTLKQYAARLARVLQPRSSGRAWW